MPGPRGNRYPIAVKHKYQYLIVSPGRGKPVNEGVSEKPPLMISTSAVYQEISRNDLTKGQKSSKLLIESLIKGQPGAVGKMLFNRLAQVVLRLYPELKIFYKTLKMSDCCGASLSGSGSCFFGLYGTRAEANIAGKKIQALGLGRVFTAQSLDG